MDRLAPTQEHEPITLVIAEAGTADDILKPDVKAPSSCALRAWNDMLPVGPATGCPHHPGAPYGALVVAPASTVRVHSNVRQARSFGVRWIPAHAHLDPRPREAIR
jgi:hypothetical protein